MSPTGHQPDRKLASPPTRRSATDRSAPRDDEAYGFYRRALQLFFESSRASIDAAIETFYEAIALDPSFALAYAGVADCYSYLFMYFDPDVNNLKYARNASKHALSLDHDLPEAHAARGLAVSLSKRYEEAEAEFEEAIRLEPSLYEAHYFYARTCFAQGKYEEACRLYEKASDINPADIQATSLLGFTYRTLGDEDRADAQARVALQRLEQHLGRHPDDPRATYLAADNLLQIGKSDEALRYAERAAALAPDDPYTIYGLACIYARTGEVDKALAALESSVASGFAHRDWIVNDSDFEPLHTDPRFEALVAGLGGQPDSSGAS